MPDSAVDAPLRVVRQSDGRVFTAVANTAMEQLRSAVGALPHGGPGPVLAARLTGTVRALLRGVAGG